ncbi:ATP guanido phosphotransferase C terminal catalytic domain [Trypanosoma vivax]|nr:ATP guanido phosphotransferase C terminal catalytic domain [Trypanosoma vivax]
MQKGGNLKEVFGRLVTAVGIIEQKVKFSRDDRLGFLTFCPTNLGTTIRASVHIKLPKLGADRAKLEEVAAKYSLQVRGTAGEHSDSPDGVYDISNKRRLGLSEYQAVKEMQDGILELIKIEQSLDGNQDDNAATAAAAAGCRRRSTMLPHRGCGKTRSGC